MISCDVRTIAGKQRQLNRHPQILNEFDFLENKNGKNVKRTEE